MNKLPLEGRSPEQQIKEAIALLKKEGYLVRGPLRPKCEVKTPAQLVNFFYDTMARFRPNLEFGYGGITETERGIAKKFIKARIDTGISKERALAECCELIILLFKYEKIVGINFPVTNMQVLGQNGMAWVTEKLINIREGLNAEVNASEDVQWREALYRKQENDLGDKLVDEAQKHLDEVLERHGEEEKRK